MGRSNIHYSENKKNILKEALLLFLTQGYESTRILDIMERCNLSKGGMYHYFSSKEEILDGVIRYAFEENIETFEETLAQCQNAMEKLALFLDSDFSSPSTFQKKYLSFRYKQKDTLVKYRIKEVNREIALTYLLKIVEDGVKEKSFHTDYPYEMASFLYAASVDLYEKSLTLSEGNQITDNVFAYCELLQKSLCIEKKAMLFFQKRLQVALKDLFDNIYDERNL